MADVLVLCYHALSPAWDADLSVTPDAFERQISYLARSGWRAVTFSEAVLNPPAERSLAITFDDAFASVKAFARPVLTEYQMPATVFAPTSHISAGGPLAWSGTAHWQSTPRADELAPMSWDDLADLAEEGWEIGSHTRTHRRLTELSDEELVGELAQSRDECTARIGRACDAIAYPYGDIDQRVVECTARVGYRAGATLPSRLDQWGVYRFPRTGIYHTDGYWRFRLKCSWPLRALRSTRLWRRPGAA